MADEIINSVEAADAPVEAAAPVVKQRTKSGRYIPSGIAYVLATFNNTKVLVDYFSKWSQTVCCATCV